MKKVKKEKCFNIFFSVGSFTGLTPEGQQKVQLQPGTRRYILAAASRVVILRNAAQALIAALIWLKQRIDSNIKITVFSDLGFCPKKLSLINLTKHGLTSVQCTSPPEETRKFSVNPLSGLWYVPVSVCINL